MHYYAGTTPGAVSIVPASAGDLAGLTAASATLTTPAGAVQTVPATLSAGEVTVTLPALVEVGVHLLHLTLSGAGRVTVLEPARIPVEATDGEGWYTLPAARRDWKGAPDDDGRLHDLLANARTQVLEYAPALASFAPVPTTYRAAQLMQARNIWNASQTDPNANQYGPDGFTAPVYPLDWAVKQMLRPKRAVPVVA